MAADQNDLKPSIGRVIRLIARWSCSTILFRYFTCRSSMLASLAGVVLFYRRAVGATLVDGDLLRRSALDGFAQEAGRAALRSRLAVRRKSTVCPALSTARYKYFHWPLTLM